MMSSRSRKAHQRIAPPEVYPTSIVVDAWVPDYGRQCEVCGQTPCVTGLVDGQVVYEGSMCGACMWDDDAYADPVNW
ncbi:hypothetical protein [Paraburkholderia sp. BR14312]|uniref:hypothetical protein n=2 Tax=Paraburkholderia TaxID=1822464 RepID=UPI0034CFE6D7